MTTHKRARAIDEHLEDYDTYVGLAREAAKQPTPKAATDAAFYLGLAEQQRGKAVDESVKQEIADVFQKTMPERIKRIEAVIKRYSKEETTQARNQLEWYAGELARLKALRK